MSADDFEFFMAHVDDAEQRRLRRPGPRWTRPLGAVPASARERVRAARLAGSDHLRVPALRGLGRRTTGRSAACFGTRYDAGLYFGGLLTGGTVDSTDARRPVLPLRRQRRVRDEGASRDLGNVEPEAQNNHPARTPQMFAAARQNLVVRDGFASFFYHPYYGRYLKPRSRGSRRWATPSSARPAFNCRRALAARLRRRKPQA